MHTEPMPGRRVEGSDLKGFNRHHIGFLCVCQPESVAWCQTEWIHVSPNNAQAE